MSNIIGYFFSLSNKPMYDILKKKYAKKNQKQKIKNAFKYDCKRVFKEMWEL